MAYCFFIYSGDLMAIVVGKGVGCALFLDMKKDQGVIA